MKKIFTRLFMITSLFLMGSTITNAQVIDDTLDFDANISKSSYTLDTVTIGNYDWALLQCLQPSTIDSRDLHFGANSIRMRISTSTVPDTGYIAMVQDKPTGLGSVSLYAGRANFSGDRTGNSPSFTLDYSTDQGATWIQVDTVDLNGVDSLAKYTFDNINISGNVRIRLKIITGDGGKRINIDSLIFTGYQNQTNTCAGPTNLVINNNNNGTANISWTAPSPAPSFGYAVVVIPQGQTPTINDAHSVLTTSYTTDSLANGDYDIFVVGICSVVPQEISDTLVGSITIHQTVGLNDIHSNITKIYPNPATNQLNVETAITEGQLEIVDITGRILDQYLVKSNHSTLNISTLPNGFYQLILHSESGTFVTRFVKE